MDLCGRLAAFIIFLLSCPFLVTAQGKNPIAQKRWVDSVYNTLADTERIGQLFMVAAYSGGQDYNEPKVTELVARRQVGGLIFMQGTPEAQAVQNNKYQRMAQLPLLIGMDAEWGLGMRLTGVKNFPRQMLLGATRDTALAYRLGVAVADQCKRLGVHINFAPVADVNNNPDNPIINARSFGENKKLVTAMSKAYMRGMQDNGVIACAKHFPGHGDTKTDSHEELPSIKKSLKSLDTLELYPFRELIRSGVKSIMVAHLEVPALEKMPNIPTTLSKSTITGLLRITMGFNGLIITDAMNMKGLTKYFNPGEADLRAFIAGNDILLFPQDVPAAIAKIKAALDSGLVTQQQLEASVKRILNAKYEMGLADWKPVEINNATDYLNKDVISLRSEAAEEGVTLVRDRNVIIDRLARTDLKIGYIGINASDSSYLLKELQAANPDIKEQWLPRGSSKAEVTRLVDKMGDNDLTVVAVHNMSFYPGSSGNYGLDDRQVDFLKQQWFRKDVMYVLMGNAYWTRNIADAGSIMVAYEDDSVMQAAVAKILLRQEDAKGLLPVTPIPGMITEIKPVLAKTTSSTAKSLKKVAYVEDAGVLNPKALDKLDMFLQRAIADGAFPGCRVFAAKDGKIFYNKSFGYYTYDKSQPVTDNTIYDVASVTKVVSTTLAVMRLYETGKLNLDKTVGDYLSWTKGTDKAGLQIRNLLLHQAGLKSWIPFYKETFDKSSPETKDYIRTDLYRNMPGGDFTLEVAKNLYLRKDYMDTIWKQILQSPLEKGKYVYSDLDFYFLAAVVQQITGKSIDKYVDEQFYKPLGLKNTTYNPLKKFNEAQIAPTEKDILFRKQLLRGHVHDPGAALFGGVAGHAGVFATANDVGVIFQMLQNKGEYNGNRYFKKETVDYFTAYNTQISRRGLGFDKPSGDKDDGGPAGNRTTGYAFGHQGFTGTCAWADPGTGVVFVFLSNRVNPSAENGKINSLSVRTIAQDYVYESLGIPVNHDRKDLYKKQSVK